MLLFPNPYSALDAKGRLAGAVHEAEPLRKSTAHMPMRRHLSAELKVAEGTYVPPDVGNRIDDQGDRFWTFDVTPLKVHVDGRTQHFWHARIKDREVFVVKTEDAVPLAELVKARVAAIEKWKAHYDWEGCPEEVRQPLDTSGWAEQFPLDTQIAEETDRILAEAKKKAEDEAKAKADAKAKAEEEAKAKADDERKRKARPAPPPTVTPAPSSDPSDTKGS